VLMEPTIIYQNMVSSDLKVYEGIIAENLDSQERQEKVAEALYVIEEQKLFLTANYKSFGAYVENHLKKSRSWAYGLIKFLKVKRACAAAGVPVPVNERQARGILLKPGQSTQRLKQLNYLERWGRVMDYLVCKFDGWQPEEKVEFSEDLLALAKEFVKTTRPNEK